MGLRERKQIAYIRENDLVTYQKYFQDSLGYELGLDFDSASFEQDMEACYNLGQFFNAVYNGVSSVGNDQVGKEALQQHVHNILITNVAEVSEKSIHLEDKTLHLHAALGNSDYDGRISASDIENWLLNNLE